MGNAPLYTTSLSSFSFCFIFWMLISLIQCLKYLQWAVINGKSDMENLSSIKQFQYILRDCYTRYWRHWRHLDCRLFYEIYVIERVFRPPIVKILFQFFIIYLILCCCLFCFCFYVIYHMNIYSKITLPISFIFKFFFWVSAFFFAQIVYYSYIISYKHIRTEYNNIMRNFLKMLIFTLAWEHVLLSVLLLCHCVGLITLDRYQQEKISFFSS